MTPTGTRPLLGISLQADEHFLALNRELIEDAAEIYEINPECLWESGCEPSPMYGLFRDIVARSGRPAAAISAKECNCVPSRLPCACGPSIQQDSKSMCT